MTALPLSLRRLWRHPGLRRQLRRLQRAAMGLLRNLFRLWVFIQCL